MDIKQDLVMDKINKMKILKKNKHKHKHKFNRRRALECLLVMKVIINI